MGKSVISVNAPRWISDGIPAAFVVFGALTIPDKTQKRIPSLFSAIGDASYSTYLSHRFGLRIATFVFVVLQGMLGLVNLWLFVALISIVSLGVGQLSYEYLERPVLVYIRSGKK
jgi:peptidoglycan/LPS O-acetylase OafA/YrhL